jgi:predicted Ser/Thr protein kinase
MADTLDAATERALVEWIETHRRNRGAVHARGNQGETYLYESGGRRLIVKVAPGAGPRGWVNRWMLRREHSVYLQLRGFAGAPRCYGLLRDRYLVLDYIPGVIADKHHITDAAAFFQTLFGYIEELHRRGVAHADLKRRDNLLVIDGDRPCLIDFGAAIVRKPGFAPINHLLYRIAQRFDYHAWVRLKYGRKFATRATPEDRRHYRRTAVERVAGSLKRSYRAVKQLVVPGMRSSRRTSGKTKSRNTNTGGH